jgi:SET domain-containing protein
MNHDDNPNAWAVKDDDDVDGRCVVTVTRDVEAGEEVCISYVDLDASSEERRTVLRDYGVL